MSNLRDFRPSCRTEQAAALSILGSTLFMKICTVELIKYQLFSYIIETSASLTVLPENVVFSYSNLSYISTDIFHMYILRGDYFHTLAPYSFLAVGVSLCLSLLLCVCY